MNDLFWDIINQRTTATFIDDIIVVIEIKERHNEVVEKVLKWLKKNNLFIKPEKCKWKVREVEFLGVVTERKSRRNAQSAGPPKYKRSAKILGTSQLL